MFGERYFATRERLAKVMREIAACAVDNATEITSLRPLLEDDHALGQPILLVVCGEMNAGKSTLFNGLCGHDLCPVNQPPATDRVRWYRHGDQPRNVSVTGLLEECYRPNGFLRYLNLVDTPGTNSELSGHLEITARFFSAADLILFVFPIANPWGVATWDAISRLPAECLTRVVFIIQQADQRDPQDVKVISGHLQDLALKRLGQVPPVFALSGKLACAAKSATPWARDSLLASGLPALENYISNNVCQSPVRRKALEAWRDQAVAALHAVDERIEDQTRIIDSQSRFIEQLDEEISAMRQQFVTRLPRHLAGVAEVFESEGVYVTKFLRRRLRALPSIMRLFTGDRCGPEIETVFIERLQNAVEAVATADGGEVAAACLAHWHRLGPRVKAAMDLDLHATSPIDGVLTEAKQRFVQRLGRAARQGIGSLKVRNQLDKELRRRNHSLKSFVFMTLVFTIAGATCGALAVRWLPAILGGLAALFLIGGVVAAWATRKAITRDFQDRLLNTCGAFASTLHADYEEALRIVFHDYAAALDDIRTHLAREKLAIEPRRRRWQKLFLTLKTIEQEL